MPKSIFVMKWAPQPFNKFMKLKEVSIDLPMTSISACEVHANELRLYLGSNGIFKILDLQTATAEELLVPGMDADKLGEAVKGIDMGAQFIICFQSTFEYPYRLWWRGIN